MLSNNSTTIILEEEFQFTDSLPHILLSLTRNVANFFINTANYKHTEGLSGQI